MTVFLQERNDEEGGECIEWCGGQARRCEFTECLGHQLCAHGDLVGLVDVFRLDVQRVEPLAHESQQRRGGLVEVERHKAATDFFPFENVAFGRARCVGVKPLMQRADPMQIVVRVVDRLGHLLEEVRFFLGVVG